MLYAYKILRIFAIGVFIVWSSVLLGYPLLGAIGHTKEVNGTVILASFMHIAGLALLYIFNTLNVYSITYLVLFSEGFILVILLYFVKKYKLLWSAENENIDG